MNLDIFKKGTPKNKNSITVFSVSHGGKLEASRPVTLSLHPNRTNLTMVQKPQHISSFLSAPRIHLPTNYNTADHYPTVKKNILNQLNCGSCWACSSTSTLTDMFVVAGYDYFWLDPVPVITCTFKSQKYSHKGIVPQGCNGGLPWDAFLFLSKVGTVSNKNYINLEQWTKKATDPDSNKLLVYNSGCNLSGKYFAKKNSIKSCVIVDDNGNINKDATIQTMKRKIKVNGGITTKFMVYYDFQLYSQNELWKATNGIYMHNINNSLYKDLN